MFLSQVYDDGMGRTSAVFASCFVASCVLVSWLLVSCVGEDAVTSGAGLPDAGAVTDGAPFDSSPIEEAGSDASDGGIGTLGDAAPPMLVNCQDAGVWDFSTPGWNGDGTPCTAGDGGFTNCALLSASDGGSAVRARSGANVPALNAALNQVARLRFDVQVNASNGTYEAEIAFARRDQFFGHTVQLSSVGATRTILLTSGGAPASLGPIGVGSTPLELTLSANSTWARLGTEPYVRVAAAPVNSNPRFQLGPLLTVGTGVNLGVTYSPVATELCTIP